MRSAPLSHRLFKCGVLHRLFLYRSFHNLHVNKRNSAPHFLFAHIPPHRSCTAIEFEHKNSNLYCYEKTISFNRVIRRSSVPVVQQARWRRNTRLARASAARHRIRRGQRTLFWCRRDQDRPLHDYGRERQHRRESRDAEPRRCLYRRNDTRFGNRRPKCRRRTIA